MKNFMRLAAAKNGDQYGFTKEDAQQYLGITWGNRREGVPFMNPLSI
ncbi:hypothetical protein BMY_0281 [Wohlfahrtiimonas chitiniclastica]|nr:hypothetical protein BMY_0281 [Wohlfahrtiimonas chitiniclastica]